MLQTEFPTIVWTDGGVEKSATIHWGTYNDSGSTEFNPSNFDDLAIEEVATLDIAGSSVSLANTFTGHSYSWAYYVNGNTIETIDPDLYKTEDGSWAVDVWTFDPETEEKTLTRTVVADGSDIYIVYVEPQSRPSGASDPDVASASTQKTVEQNPDGTYTVTLDVTGGTVSETTKIGANVLLVLDRTSSMRGNMGQSKTRWNVLEEAVGVLVDTLTTDDEGNPRNLNIEYAVVDFQGRDAAWTHTWNPYSSSGNYWTNSGTTVDNFVTNTLDNPPRTATGTSWYAGLNTALTPAKQADKNDTYVIFMTDGEPNSQTGSQTNAGRALVQDTTNGHKIYLYGVFCGTDSGLTTLRNFVSNIGGVNTLDGSTEEDLKNAFKNIASTVVKNLSPSDVSVDDGVPTLSSVSAQTSGEASGFEYYTSTNGETWTEWEDYVGASYSSDNGVTWDLSSVGQVTAGSYYRLKFKVWPSQEAYDYIADLNNGLVTPIPSDEELLEKGIDKNSDGVYYLLTNTHLNTNYTFGDKTYSDSPNVLPTEEMILPTPTITVEKYWHNEMDTRTASDVTLTVTQDGKNYKDVQMGAPVETIPGKEWEQKPEEEIYISVGFMSCDSENNLVVHSSGHDYTVIEPESFSYRWDLTADIYHPMLINDDENPTILIEVMDEDVPAALESLANNKKATDGGKTYYKFDNKLYVVEPGKNALVADNDRRSNLAVNKVVTGTDAPKDKAFAIQLTLDNPNGKHSGDEGYDKDYDAFWFSVQTDPADRDTVVKEGVTVKGATAEEGNTGFYWFDNGGTVTVNIKADQYICFVNLPKGTTYTVEELDGDEMPDGFVFTKAESDANNKAGETSTPAEITEMKADGTIDKPNTDYSVTYTNNYLGVFYVYHSSDNTVERYPMAVNGVQVTEFNIFELTKTGTLYGGYYSDYAGKSSGFDAAALEYDDAGKSADEGGTEYSYAYIATDSGKTAWDYSNGYDVDGEKMVPVTNTVYYLKEVPTGYLMPYTHYTYYKADKKIATMWTILATDDLNYKNAGFLVETEDKPATMVESMTIKAQNSTATTTLTAAKVYRTKGVLYGYLGYADISSYLGNETLIRQYWVTKDNHTIYGIKQRTLTYKNGNYTITDLGKTDGDFTSPNP